MGRQARDKRGRFAGKGGGKGGGKRGGTVGGSKAPGGLHMANFRRMRAAGVPAGKASRLAKMLIRS